MRKGVVRSIRLAKLSAPTPEGAAATAGPSRRNELQTRMSASATCVLPVPGGPWMHMRRCTKDSSTACRCDAFKDASTA
eukprot:12700-Lingulodinium_polyedra.AAC.1